MKWFSCISEESDSEKALADNAKRISEALDGAPPDLLVMFVSVHHQRQYPHLAALAGSLIGPNHLIGCSAGGVIADGLELEQKPGLAMVAALLPDVTLIPFRLEDEDIQDIDPEEIPGKIGVPENETAHFLLLPDPFSFQIEKLARLLDWSFPNSEKIGGLASAGQSPGQNALFLEGETHRSGLVGMALYGDITVDSVVAQGCRPVGAPMFITSCRDNMLISINGQPPKDVLQQLFDDLPPEDRDLFRRALFLGLEMKPKEDAYRQGDFLIRNIFGMDGDGHLMIGAELQETSVAQFHIRDANTSHEDLKDRLARYGENLSGPKPEGALLFSCLGRGQHLYGQAGHDTNLFHDQLGPIPLGGFFCNGEIGPVQGQTFIHGYTSCFGIFKKKTGSQ